MSLRESESVFQISDAVDLQIAVSRTNRLGLLDLAGRADKALIATMVSELGSNIIKYAGRGKIRLSANEYQDYVDIHLLSEDEGPGIADVEAVMRDNYSTGKTLGLGLPGVRRMADEFWIRSDPGQGTLVYARRRIRDSKAAKPTPKGMRLAYEQQNAAQPWQLGTYIRPMQGEQRAGDIAFALGNENGQLLVLADVTGHGEYAHSLTHLIQEILSRQHTNDLQFLMGCLHQALVGSLGAAVGLIQIDSSARCFRFVGVGNIVAVRCRGQAWRGIPRDGILGQRLPSLYQQEVILESGDVLAMWSDGMSELAGQRFIEQNADLPAPRLAYEAVRSLGRPYDDASCIVYKWL